MLGDWFQCCRAQLKHYLRYYHVDLRYSLSCPSMHGQNVLNFMYHCLLYIQPSCLLFQAVFIVDDLCSLCLCRTGAKPEKATGLGRQPSSKRPRHYVRVMRISMCRSTAASLFLLITGRKECCPVCLKTHLCFEQSRCLPPCSMPANYELCQSREAELVEMSSNICDVDMLPRQSDCPSVKRTIISSTLSFTSPGSD